MKMGRSDLNWRKIVRNVFRPRTTHGHIDIPAPATPVKSSAKLSKPSGSFRFFRNLSNYSSEETRDDTSSFMSPMPRELRSTSFENADLLSPLGSDDEEDWGDSDEANSARLSFIECSKIIGTFPAPPSIFKSQTPLLRRRGPPIPVEDWDDSCETNSARLSFIECSEIISTFPEPPVFKSQTPTLRRHGLDQPLIPATLLNERSHDRASSSRRHLKQRHNRSPAPFPSSIHHGSLQYSTTCIPFDLLSRTDQMNYFDGAPSNSSLLRFPSPSHGSSTSLQLSLASSSPRPRPARSQS